MFNETTINLRDCFFTEKEHEIIKHSEMKATIFRYASGVAGLKVENKRGSVIMLPFQGQQIWRCFFDGRELAMKSIFNEPEATSDYLGNYGCFFLHCGATAVGVPAKNDTHPLHGELPNARYKEAYVSCGKNSKGNYIAIGGRYEHKIAFNHRYLAEPLVTIYEDSGVLDISIKFTNLLKTQMELMYLAHINFRPVDNSELAYSAKYDPEHVAVNINVPEHIKTSAPIEDFKAFLRRLKDDPVLHHHIDPDALFDPEVVISIKYDSDETGAARSMQVHPDGYADYVLHYPAQLPRALRWIARNPDHDAMGLVLPSTSGNDGYIAERAAGNFIALAPGASIKFDLQAGLLTAEEASQMKRKIENR